MPFLPPNQQRQSTEGMLKKCKGFEILFSRKKQYRHKLLRCHYRYISHNQRERIKKQSENNDAEHFNGLQLYSHFRCHASSCILLNLSFKPNIVTSAKYLLLLVLHRPLTLIPGLKPSFSANPSQHSLPFLLQD